MKNGTNLLPDEELVGMAQAGDRAAFDCLCDRHLPRVYNRVRVLVPPEAAEDVTQEVFVSALRGLRRFRQRSLFRTWLYAIIRHKVADYYRRRSRRPSTVPLDAVNVPARAVDGWEERAAVRLALRRLPVHYQEILLLRFAEGLPFNEVAQVLGISLEAAKSRYRRAVAAMAQEIGAGDEEE